MDGQGRLLVHHRSALKDIWPSWCDLAVGGVVGSGEDYLAAAHRELSEEVGIETTELIHLDDGVARPYQDDQVSLMARCFAVITNGPFSFDDGEVTQARWVHRDGLDDLLTREKFLPDSVALVLPLLDI